MITIIDNNRSLTFQKWVLWVLIVPGEKKMNPGIFPRNSRINNANANDMHIYCKLQHSICLFGIFLGFFYVRLGTGRTHIGGFGTHRLGIGVIQKHVALGIGDTGLRIGETGIWDWGNRS